MRQLSTRQRKVFDVMRLLVFGTVGFLLAYKDFYGNIPFAGELAINAAVILILEIAIKVFLIDHELRQKYLLIPHEVRGGRNLELLTTFSDLVVQAAGDYGEPKISMIRTCVEKQFATLRSDLSVSGSVRFYVSDLAADSIQDLFSEGVKRTDRIVATCFTEMEDFWYLEPVGGDFLKINLNLLNGERERMRRIFCVQDEYWDHSEIKKRELIRLLTHMGCKCRVITRRKVDEEGLPDPDLFIVRDGQKISFGFKWTPSPGGDTSTVLLTLRDSELSRLDSDFDKLWERSEPLSETWATSYPLNIPKTGDAARAYLEKLYDYKSVKPTNVAFYLRSASTHLDSVARYWRGLEGTLIRPSAAAVAWFKAKLPAARRPDGRPAKVGILGATPELRRLAADHFPDSTVHVFDLSLLMVNAMRALAQGGPGQPPLKERVVIQNWLTLNLSPKELGSFDCILGVDVLNMMNLTNMEHLLKVVADLLCDRGVFITQAITKPPREEYAKHYRRFNRMALTTAYRQLHPRVGKDITAEEMFAALCLGRLGDGDSVYVGGLVAEMEAWEDNFDGDKPLSRKYNLCNTTLFVPERSHLEKLMEKSFDIADWFAHENTPRVIFRDYMLGYQLTKRGRPR